jgi:hypothetical protein
LNLTYAFHQDGNACQVLEKRTDGKGPNLVVKMATFPCPSKS